MAQVDQATLLDANGDPIDVATITALIKLVGDLTANPPANSLLDRLKTITTTTLGVNQVSSAHDFTVTMTRPNDTAAYTAGDVIGDATNGGRMQFTNMSKAEGGTVQIIGAQLEIDVTPPPASAFRLWLFSANPTAVADNAAFDVPIGDRLNYLGYIDILAPINGGSISVSDVNGLCKQIKLPTTSIFGILQAVSGYTPTALATYKVTLHTVDA